MPYNRFTIHQISRQFAVQIREQVSLFPTITPVNPGNILALLLDYYVPLAEAIGTEKAKSEFIIALVLAELGEL